MQTGHDTNTSIAFPVLIGDIGGTNARFAILVDAYAAPKEFPVIPTASYKTIDEAIQRGVLDKTSLQPRSAVLAIAGPIKDDEVDLTNAPWIVKPRQMIAEMGFKDVILINDFEAQAMATTSVEQDRKSVV